MFVPKLATTLQTYTRTQFTKDLIAGLIVGIVALPLAIAFAVASGATPDRGLYTAIVAGFLISALGGSRVQIGGPTGAFVVIIYGVIQQHGMEGLLVATIMAGVLLVVLGLSGLGSAIKFVPHPLIVGFTSAIGVLIFSSQVKDLLGMPIQSLPAGFVAKWQAYASSLAHLHVSWSASLLALSAILIITIWPKLDRRIPGPFVALVLTTLAARMFHLDVETLGQRFGTIAATLPRAALPHASIAEMRALFPSAVAIALLGAIESLLSAVVADGMIGGRHRSNMELVAQGFANIASPLFGGLPATGAIARTATNVKNGGRTPVAGIVHAATLLLITLFFGRWAGLIPFATLAAILSVVAWHMCEWKAFRSELSAPRSDVLVLLATFCLTLAVDLVVAIEVGMVLSAFAFMKRMSEVTNVQVISREFQDNGDSYQDDPNGVRQKDVPDGVVVFEVNGPFFFGAASSFKEQAESVMGKPKVLIIRMRNVNAIDATGLHTLREIVRRSRREKTKVFLAEIHSQPIFALGKSELLGEIGEDNLFGTIDEALAAARVSMAG